MLDLLTPLLREARGEALAQALAVPPALRLGAPPLPVGGGRAGCARACRGRQGGWQRGRLSRGAR